MKKFFGRIALSLCSLGLVLGTGSDVATANPGIRTYGPGLETNEELERRVEFWLMVFTKYGKEHSVFHHRDHPDIIYSVLDFSEEAQKYSGSALSRVRSRAIDAETERIRKTLLRLADGEKPSSPFERRLRSLFSAHAKGERELRRKYRDAAEEKQIRTQTGIKERFRDGVRRSGRYMYAIEKVFELHNLPVELGRLPLVESSFDYTAYSSAGAAGIWQFTRSTGKRYMKITAAVDERRDPIVATRAAADYLANAYSKLGSWPLALTSYNHGLSGIMRAVKATGSRDLARIIREYDGASFGFASGNFYAEFLAALHVEQHYKAYFPDLRLDPPVYFDEVRLERSVSFSTLAKQSGLSEEDFRQLNPALLKPVYTGRTRVPSGYVARVPRGKGRTVVAALGAGQVLPLLRGIHRSGEVRAVAEGPKTSQRPGALASLAPEAEPRPSAPERARREREPASTYQEAPQDYRVQRGDTVSELARRFGVTSQEILSANGLHNARSLRAGRTIKIPAGAEAHSTPSEPVTAGEARAEVTYAVRSGDTVSSIARHFGVSTKQILAANGIADPRALRAGQTLRIPGGGEEITAVERDSVTSSVEESTYTVQRGDTPSAIARKFGVSTARLLAENGIANPRALRAGRVLQIPAGSAAELDDRVAPPAVQRVYTVRQGDSLSRIARRHGVSVSALKERNPEARGILRPGQKVVIP